jgi:hypothetical protein
MAGRHEHQRIAVRRRLGDGGRADRAAGAAAIVDHDRLAQALVQLLAEHAGDDVGAAAGGVGHDEPDRPVGVGVRRAGGRQHRRAAEQGRSKQGRAKKRDEQGDDVAPSHRPPGRLRRSPGRSKDLSHRARSVCTAPCRRRSASRRGLCRTGSGCCCLENRAARSNATSARERTS